MLRSLSLLVSLTCIGSLASQSATVFSIPDANASTGNCNSIPFGSGSLTSSFNNMRYQTVVTAADLGNMPTVICGLRFAACATGLARFDALQIRMDHLPAGALFSTTFAANLSASPTVVLDVANYEWQTVATTWNDVGLQQSFVYNGVDDLLIDITTVNALRVGGGSSGFHRDTRPRVYRSNYDGTQTTGVTSNGALKMQLHFADASAWTYGAGCAGTNGTPTLSFSADPVIGQSFDVELGGGAVNAGAVLLISVSNRAPYPLDLGILGASGCQLYVEPLINVGSQTDANGDAAVTIALGPATNACELPFYMQWLLFDGGANPFNVTLSDYGRVLPGF